MVVMTRNNESCVFPLPEGPWISSISPRLRDEVSPSAAPAFPSGSSLDPLLERYASSEGMNVGPRGDAGELLSEE
jgi:hypothetical protein